MFFLAAEKISDFHALRVVSVNGNQKIAVFIGKRQIVKGNAFAETDGVAAGIFPYLVQSVASVPDVNVVAFAAVKDVVSPAADNGVVSVSGIHAIVAAAGMDNVVKPAGRDFFRFVRLPQFKPFVRKAHFAAVGKLQRFVNSLRSVEKIADDNTLFVAASDHDLQIMIIDTAEFDFVGINSFTENNGVVVLSVVDGVQPVARTPEISVVAGSAGKEIVTAAAFYPVVAAVAEKRVVSVIAEQNVVAVGSRKTVVLLIAVDRFAAAFARHAVPVFGNIVVVPDGTVGKLDPVNHRAGCSLPVKIAQNANRIFFTAVVVADRDDEVKSLSFQFNILRQNLFAETNNVRRRSFRVGVDVVHRVVAEALVEKIEVGAVASGQIIVARTAG